MAVAPNQKKLLIPNKNQGTIQYATDMRTIEQWANALQTGGGITEITTGTPSILTITNPTGPVVNIDSTGGGGGGGQGFVLFTAGMDLTIVPAAGSGVSAWMGPSNANTTENSFGTLFDNASGFEESYTFSMQWIVFPISGKAMVVLPELNAPTFTGGPLLARFIISAWSSDSNQVMSASTGITNIASGGAVRPADTDYTIDSTFGTDLTLTPGVGIVTSGGGGAVWYLASTQFSIGVPTGVTFT